MAAKSINVVDFKKELPGAVDPNQPTVYAFPQITSSNNATGKKTYWRIIVRLVTDPGTPNETFHPIVDEYFNSKAKLPNGACGWIKVVSKTGEAGKIRDTVPDIVTKGKNIGKANETSAFTQALRDAFSKHNLQTKKVKAESDDADDDDFKLYPPMLAQNKEKISGTVDYTRKVHVQRKYNGVRSPMVMNPNGDIIMYSRRRNIYPEFDVLKAEAKTVFDFYYDKWSDDERFGGTLFLDGEIYKHGEKLQDIAGVARKEGKQIDLQYYVYDLFIPEHPDLKYTTRKILFDALAKTFADLPHIKFVETFEVHSEAETKALYDRFIAEKYEGAMVRLDEPYRYSYNEYHSDVLLKMKPVEDAEYKIVNYTQGSRGKAKGKLMMVCETAAGKQFNVDLKDYTEEEAKKLFTDMSVVEANGKPYFDNHYKGKMLTVYYEELSKDGVPQRAKTSLVVRDYE